ncbi:MAG: hypothetical protein H7Y13_06270 [Sphingobacteriaceae bacterium]|nr:hypothetical protein [Sphingobacteriaceae bacterium]
MTSKGEVGFLSFGEPTIGKLIEKVRTKSAPLKTQAAVSNAVWRSIILKSDFPDLFTALRYGVKSFFFYITGRSVVV